MIKKNILFNQPAREKLLKGINIVANAVKITLGPKGRTVVMPTDYGKAKATKDGVTVAKGINLVDPAENHGAQIIKEASAKTNASAGDGTTTAAVLAQAMINEGHKYITAGANPIDIKRGMEAAATIVLQILTESSEDVKNDWDKIRQIAIISANNDEFIGKMIGDAMESVTVDGVITVEEAKTSETYVEHDQGLNFDRGWISPHFVNEGKTMQCLFEKPLILLCDRKIRDVADLIPALNIALDQKRPLLIIAEEVEAQALSLLVVNKLKADAQFCAVKAPAFANRRKEILEDLAIVTGGLVITENRGITLQDIEEHHFGECEKAIINQYDTTLIGGGGDEDIIKAREDELRARLAGAKTNYDKEKLAERLAKLVAGVARIYVGAPTEVEMREKKDRVDDALHATKAALKEGIVPGGGTALLSAKKTYNEKFGALTVPGDDTFLGVQVVLKSLESPAKTIVENAGEEGSVIINKITEQLEKHPNFGYNSGSSSYEEDMKHAGIIDPAMVTKQALQNALSTATTILMTECVITDVDDEYVMEEPPEGLIPESPM